MPVERGLLLRNVKGRPLASMKRLLIAVFLAAGLTSGLVALARVPSDGPMVFSLLILPFYMFGVAVSHNAHQPNEIASFGSMFCCFFLLTFGGQVLWSRYRGGAK